ncbi:MAG: class I SAM-dependent methyltransferase [Wenzhouxiangella sp.]|nr:MAG: class I SAM-dependent methyltransferase [Wenzhouxiangella sp.]
MQRIPEPELMDEPAQARAYAEADFSEPNQLFADAVVEALGDHRAGTMIDLGCGPGDICLRLARALPRWRLTALDAGPNMLALAREALDRASLSDRIELRQARLPRGRPEQTFDAVISNSLLHHLPDPMTLWQSIAALAGPGAYVQVMDLQRPDSVERARRIVDQHAADAPAILREDFYNSLLAAWTADEAGEQINAAGLAGLRVSRPSERHWMASGFVGRD